VAKIVCNVCKGLISITSKEWHYIDPRKPVCSKECVMKWIVSQNGEMNEDYDYMIIENGERADAAFSEKLGMWFRSLYEMFFAEAVADDGLSFEYEKYAFRIDQTSIYVPDFFFPDYGCFVEVKGEWGVGSKKKTQGFRRAFPDLPLLVVPWTLREEFYPDEFC